MQEEHGDDAKEDAEALHQKQKELYFLKGQLQQIEEEDLQSVNQKGKSGLFLGVGVGNMLFNYNAKLDYPVLLNFRIGYQQFFPRTSAGLRFYADMANVFYGKQKQTIWAALTTLNIDVVGDIMLDKKKRYGISFSGGIGAGSLMGKRTSRDAALFGFNNNKLEKQWALTFNLGVGVVLNLKHRIELQMKIPPSSLEINSFLKFRSVYMVNYQYTF
ncbi:outer membrane beta-barrel protein [Helicobacter mustelae]|nr:outer membrane beta-barrel protein [Helicobacter mustelae]